MTKLLIEFINLMLDSEQHGNSEQSGNIEQPGKWQ